MLTSEVRRLANSGYLDEAWIGTADSSRVFARKATWDADQSLLVVTDVAGGITMLRPAEITSVRH